jgi:hypothetical protein
VNTQPPFRLAFAISAVLLTMLVGSTQAGERNPAPTLAERTEQVGKRAGQGIDKAGKNVEKGLEIAARKTGQGLKQAGKGVKKGLDTAAKAVDRAFQKAD